ncbi:MAG: fluoride efflux transporter CrcB [Gemmatimonadota bacterium]
MDSSYPLPTKFHDPNHPLRAVTGLLVVASGGAVGAALRYLTTGWIQDLTGSLFPWGTMAVNVIGSFLLGFSVAWLNSTLASPETRQLVTIGFLGSFTTFSTFSYETVAMLEDGEFWQAGFYSLGSFLLGLLAVMAGAFLAANLLHSRS